MVEEKIAAANDKSLTLDYKKAESNRARFTLDKQTSTLSERWTIICTVASHIVSFINIEWGICEHEIEFAVSL